MSTIFFIGDGATEGTAAMKDLLGGKGANLAEMSNIGIPVPPGFTISTDVCREYLANPGALPETLRVGVTSAMARLERSTGRRFGDPSAPLLVSVRSGAPVSMPGMMDTVLNLGLNEETARGLGKQAGNDVFAFDSYRRFVQMYADVVFGVKEDGASRDPFESAARTVMDRRERKLMHTAILWKEKTRGIGNLIASCRIGTGTHNGIMAAKSVTQNGNVVGGGSPQIPDL